MARPSATDRVDRILALVPWIAERDEPTIDEICQRFSISRKELLADLDVVLLVGVYPYTPDAYISVLIADDRVSIDYGNHFERPLRLSKREAVAVIATGKAASTAAGHDADGPLARGLAKIAAVLNIDLDDDLEVVLPDPAPETRATIEAAVAARVALDIGYYSHARALHTERRIEPLRVYHADGAWYLDAYCRDSEADRVFRLDRITSVDTTDERFEREPFRDDHTPFQPDVDLPRVTIEVDPAGSWVAQEYPVEACEVLDGGVQRLTLAVSAVPWLERLLLRLGPNGRVVDPAEFADVAADAATRLLDRYRA